MKAEEFFEKHFPLDDGLDYPYHDLVPLNGWTRAEMIESLRNRGTDDRAFDIDTGCAYLSDEGARCAVGALLPTCRAKGAASIMVDGMERCRTISRYSITGISTRLAEDRYRFIAASEKEEEENVLLRQYTFDDLRMPLRALRLLDMQEIHDADSDKERYDRLCASVGEGPPYEMLDNISEAIVLYVLVRVQSDN